MRSAALWASLGLVVLLLGTARCERAPEEMAAPTPAQAQGGELAGTSWRLVRFEGGDGTVLTPAPATQYTLAFAADGKVSARIDCNRGSATWKSAAPSMLELGPLALTRAMCPPGSMHDQIVRQWPYVRSYVLKDGHLYLWLMADGGIYEYAPMGSAGGTSRARPREHVDRVVTRIRTRGEA